MTGDRNRTANFSDIRTQRQFAFDQFTARACEPCNNRWSKLEQSAQPVVESLAIGNPNLTEADAEVLLDWFDKVRVGVWLGGLALGGNPFGIRPNFRVDARRACHDRLLYLARATEPSLRLTFADIGHPVFQHAPTFFMLYANGVAFVNASAVGIAAGPLGLPRVRRLRTLTSGMVEGASPPASPQGFAAPLESSPESSRVTQPTRTRAG